ncbi:hypothetical protein C8A03DRAFT_18105 [Achaetomium macrosporum]|uniref:Protein kinase domain-containing protein n=1 Tax=Achaetomium macrosporum TaxID=79813 RepID=A0AAN7H951_9PEZI|nr:hypothetical protein C8A03DRAFT_18105 [Achaetomium macrosporum]
MEEEDDDRTFRQQQRWLCYKFHIYRTTGRRVKIRERNHLAFQRFHVPKPGRYPGVRKSFRVRPEPYYSYTGENPDASHHGPPENVSRALRKLKQDLKPITGVRFAKLLGYGGNGLAALFFSEERGASYRRKYFVVKSTSWPEQTAHLRRARAPRARPKQKFQDAMHIVQFAGLPRPIQPRRSARIRAQQGGQGGQAPQRAPGNVNTEGMIILEYLMRGSLHKALCTATAENLHFPSRVLWHIFHCCNGPRECICNCLWRKVRIQST